MGTAISGEEPTEQLKSKAKHIDTQLLEFKESGYYGDGSGNTNVEWDNMLNNKSPNDLLEQSIDPNNNKINYDPCVQRLIFIVNQYNIIQNKKSSPFQFIYGLKSYSLVQLLNDWIHLKSVYIDNKYENPHFNPSALWDYLNMSLNESDESQYIYTRNIRDKSVLGQVATRKDVYNGFSDTQNVVAIHILDAIHCYFYHGEPVDDNDKKLIQQKREWEIECGVEAQLENVSTMLQHANDDDEHKEYNLLKEKKSLLLFGDSFFYWDYHQGDTFYCKAKYKTLKDEILGNNIFNLTQLQYNDVLFQSELWHKSILGQYCTAFNRGKDNEEYEVQVGLPLTVSHIMSILLFTNYDLLRYKYINNGCNKVDINESYQDTKRRNTEIGIWYRLIKEVVMFYGEMTTKKDSFYQSIDHHLLFDSVAPNIKTPFIVSSSLSAARINTPDTGGIIEYTQHSSLDNAYIDISYCSPFPHRDLKLFGQVSVLEMRDIHIGTKSQRRYIMAMLIFLRMINGGYYHHLCDSVGNDYQKALMQMMDNELMNDREKRGPTYLQPNYHKSLGKFEGVEQNGVLTYIQALFSYLIRNSTEMWIIQSEYKQLNNALRNYLFTLHDNAFKPFTVLWNKRLRKALKQELAFKFVNEYSWQLGDDDMAYFNKLKEGETMEGVELTLKKTQDNPDGFVLCAMLSKVYSSNGLGGFGITLSKLPNNCRRVLLGWNVYCADANDFIMTTPPTVMYQGDTVIYSTFPSHIIGNKSSITFKICIKISQ